MLAQLVELNSVIATGGRWSLKEVIELPRPQRTQPAAAEKVEVNPVDTEWTKGFLARRRMAAWGTSSAADVSGDEAVEG